MDDSPPCALFCQQKVTYTYDQEQILPGEVVTFGNTVHAGETIFVYVDCLTLEPLSCDDGTKQDPAFCAPGVALPREVAIASIKALPPAPTGSEGATLVDSAKDTGGIIQATGNPEAAKSSQVGFGASVVPSAKAATTTQGGGAGTQAPCSVVTTTATGTIAPGPATYCTCGETMAGINTVTGAGGTAYSVCALGGDNAPTVGTITPGPKSSAPPATTKGPAPSSTASGESGDCPGGTFGSSAECGENCLGGGTCDCGGTALGQPICLCNCP
ncbi:MAG: hypothetical protein Q9167_002469 [Letrouitia subvulpina]